MHMCINDRRFSGTFLVALLLVACGPGSGEGVDAGSDSDTTEPDSGLDDAGTGSSVEDAGSDSGGDDAGSEDAGSDGGGDDAGPDSGENGPGAAAIEARLDEIIDDLSLEEKVAQMAGSFIFTIRGLWHTPGIERFGLPGYRMTDGPRGLTTNSPLYGAVGQSPSTCFPVGMARGATFDVELEERIGRAIGLEVRAVGGNVVLAPVINILRQPGWGRAQETYGEDTHHIGRMGAAFIRGAQENVIASVKHFALNSIENTRFEVDVQIGERALREIYLPHFKKAVMEARAGSVMTAYNSSNGYFCSENQHLLSEILKGEWGFDGFVESDWLWGTHSTAAAVNAGLDIEMPFADHFGDKLLNAVTAKEVSLETIDGAVRRILRKQLEFELDTRSYDAAPDMVDEKVHGDLALEAAAKSIVLLKNDEAALPLDREEVTSIAVVGSFAEIGRTGDEGSSNVNPAYLITPMDGLQNRAGSVEIRSFPEDLLSAENKADIGAADAAIVIVGFTPEQEGERLDIFNTGGDRDILDLSVEHEALIREVSDSNQRTIVVIEAGSAVTMESWHADVEAVLLAWYPGQEGGNAIADVLFGDVNPSGRLPLSIPVSLAQLPEFDTSSTLVTYDYFHGYRHLDRHAETPRYPFGYGLSYTEFGYSGLMLSDDVIESDGVLAISLDVTNIGERAGSEVVQLYVSYQGSSVERAPKDLKGFARVQLEPGETQTVTINLPAEDLAFYDEQSSSWIVEELTYTAHVGPSAGDLPLEQSFQLLE